MQIRRKLLAGLALALAALGGVFVGQYHADVSLAATVITTNLTDTIGTFRTNVNTNETNLNADIQTRLVAANNLSDLTNTSTARTNLGLTDTATIASSSFLKVANNLSDLNNAGTARTNLGLGTAATHATGDFLQTANNLSDLTSTSSARTNIGFSAGSGLSLSGAGAFSITAPVSIPNGGTGTTTIPTVDQFLVSNGVSFDFRKLVAGSNITISTSSTSTTINSSASTAVGGSDTQVEYNNNGVLGATSTITVNSSTPSFSVGKSANFTNAFNSTTTATATIVVNFTGATTTWVVPHGVTSVRFIVDGAGGQTGTVSAGGKGGEASGTVSTTEGTVFTLNVGGKGSGGVGGFGGGGSTTGGTGGGGMSWVSTSTSFGTSTVLIVGAGGGGGRSNGTNLPGGDGGGIVGAAGGGSGGQDGKGGSQTAGGTPGGDGSATAGSAGTGGNGGTSLAFKGAGGGGGYFGGGGGSSVSGGDSGAGGGGSSFTKSIMTATSTATSTGALTDTNGSITIQYLGTPSYSIAAQDHILTGNIASSTVTACGASPTAAGNDTAGAITIGSGSITSCTYNFAHNWFNAPACTANTNTTSSYASILTTTTSSVKFGFSSALASGIISYICLGY